MEKEKNNLLSLIEKFRQKRIAVWGDLILDEYLTGTTRRISREAPVLILSYQKKEFTLGGAGNSLLNLRALGATPLPIGVIGKDGAGEQILDILNQHRIPSKYVLRERAYLTPVKTRILAGEENTRKQQILRIDREAEVPEDGALKQKMLGRLLNARKECDALLISDYNYGTVKENIFRNILPRFRQMRLPVTLDSRFRLLHFKGVTIATPNAPEVEGALRGEIGDDRRLLQAAGRQILRKLASPALLITLGSRGMALFQHGKPVVRIPIHGSPDIVDVAGAGDTVISVLTLALSSGASFRQAALLANYAGGLVVMKKGTATITASELRKAVVS